MTLIHVRKCVVQVVLGDDDSEIGVGGPDLGAGCFQVPYQPTIVAVDGHAGRRQPLFNPTWRRAKRRPIGRPCAVHAMVRGDDVTPRGKRADRRNDFGAGMSVVEGGDDLVKRAFPIEQR